MAKHDRLPKNEQKAVQAATIIMIVVLVYLFFVTQRIIAAMLVGVAFLGVQRAYLHFRTRTNT